MKKLFLSLLFISSPILTQQSLMILKNDTVIYQEGDCDKRHSPGCSFNIAISLMGYNEHILKDENHPELPYDVSYNATRVLWQQSHTPSSWIKNSCVWYSQCITKKLGAELFKQYVESFDYGNKDTSGDKGKNNGLSHCWISSSLKISVREQIAFINKFLNGKLPVSQEAIHLTRNIFFSETVANQYQLFSKTGGSNCCEIDCVVCSEIDYKIGWYVGWMQNDKDTIIFALCIYDDSIDILQLVSKAKSIAKEKLLESINHHD